MRRSFGIDLVRTLSIAIVILIHYGFYQGFNFGYYAIEFLFVISGFLIGQILFNDFYSTDQVQTASLKRFMIRRWFRILPLYYFMILVKFILDPSIGWNVLYYVFFLQNHFYGISWYPETWTLVIDEWFYLGVPIMLFLFMRLVSSRKQAVVLFIIGVILMINLLRILWVYYTDTKFAGIIGNVPLRQDTLLFGVLLAYIKMHYRIFFNKLNSLAVFLTSFTILLGYIYLMYTIKKPVDRINEFFWTRTINFGIVSLLVMTTLPYIENSIEGIKVKSLNFVNKAIVWGSKLSYALYLVHFEVLVQTREVMGHFGITKGVSIQLIAVLFTIIISYLLYEYMEKKFLILRDRYFPDRPHLPL